MDPSVAYMSIISLAKWTLGPVGIAGGIYLFRLAYLKRNEHTGFRARDLFIYRSIESRSSQQLFIEGSFLLILALIVLILSGQR